MNYTVKAVLGAAVGMLIAGSTQAAELSVSLGEREPIQQVRWSGRDCDDRRYIRAPDRDDPCAGRYYGRPVRDHWDRHWSRPVYGRPHWRDDDCRTIIRRRVNAWGEVVVTRTRVCH